MIANKLSNIFCDWNVNTGRPEIQFLLLQFRIAQWARVRFAGNRRFTRLAAAPFVIPYYLYSRFAMSFDVPPRTSIGPRCRVHHAHGIVINSSAVIGADVVLRHGTTLGSRVSGSDAPVIGDRVDVGAGVMILGKVSIGDDAKLGAGSIVLQDVPAGGVTVAGAKARLLQPKATTGTSGDAL